jgi:hypothetical protein
MDRDDKPGQKTTQRWEQQLTVDYREYRWKQVMEPLCDRLQRWRDGNLSHTEMDQILEEIHNQTCEIRSLFAQRQDRLVMLVQWLDRDWFKEWVAEHAPPKGARLAPEVE